jgi:hypothetical protein
MSQLKDAGLLAKEDTLSQIHSLLQDYPALYLETFGSDLNRLAICRFIQCLALSQWPADSESRQTWISILETSLLRKEEALQSLAASAFGDFCEAYGLVPDMLDRFIDLASNLNHGPINRRGYVLALGQLPKEIILEHSLPILKSLICSVKVYVGILRLLLENMLT